MNDDLLEKLTAAAGLGLLICSHAAERIKSMEREIEALKASANKARADSLAIAFESQRQAIAVVHRDIEYALNSQSYDEPEDLEEAVKDATVALSKVVSATGMEQLGAKLLDDAREAPSLRKEVGALRLSIVAGAGLNPNTLRREGIFCNAIDVKSDISTGHGCSGAPVVAFEGNLTTIVLNGRGPGASSLYTIGQALRSA